MIQKTILIYLSVELNTDCAKAGSIATLQFIIY
jgi:hypothetical protein